MPRVVLEALVAVSWTSRRLMVIFVPLNDGVLPGTYCLHFLLGRPHPKSSLGTMSPSSVKDNFFICTQYCLRGKNNCLFGSNYLLLGDANSLLEANNLSRADKWLRTIFHDMYASA